MGRAPIFEFTRSVYSNIIPFISTPQIITTEQYDRFTSSVVMVPFILAVTVSQWYGRVTLYSIYWTESVDLKYFIIPSMHAFSTKSVIWGLIECPSFEWHRVRVRGTIKPKLPTASGGHMLPEILYCLSPTSPQSLAPPLVLNGRNLLLSEAVLENTFGHQCFLGIWPQYFHTQSTVDYYHIAMLEFGLISLPIITFITLQEVPGYCGQVTWLSLRYLRLYTLSAFSLMYTQTHSNFNSPWFWCMSPQSQHSAESGT